MIPFLDLRAQYLSIRDEIDEAMAQVIADSAFVGGAHGRTFEEAFAEFQGAAHCVGVGNGTDAIEIALEALDLPADSEVIVPANSFIASAEAVTRTGHRVVFCDADSATYLLDLEDVQRRATDRTAAVVAVHLYGNPCDLDALVAWARPRGIRVLEDAAQAHGAEWQGRRVGALGDVGTFSFYPGKNLGAFGDGGAITTNDAELAKRCRMIANHGRIDKYDHLFEGRNSRLDGLQAAVLGVKLRHLDRWVDRRNQVARRYLAGLADVPGIRLPVVDGDRRHAWHLFVIRTREREALRAHLARSDIQTGVHYPISLPRLAAYAYLDPDGTQTFVADELGPELLSLPMGEHLTDQQVDRVVEAVKEFAMTTAVVES